MPSLIQWRQTSRWSCTCDFLLFFALSPDFANSIARFCNLRNARHGHNGWYASLLQSVHRCHNWWALQCADYTKVTPGSGWLDTPALAIHPLLSGVRLHIAEESSQQANREQRFMRKILLSFLSFHFNFLYFPDRGSWMGHYISLH